MPTRIMVIDDEPLIRRLLRYQLGGNGYEVVEFAESAEALGRLAYDPPDLVLLDVMMPGMSGWDVCRQIRVTSEVPVIMLTAKSADDDVVLGLNCGADDYICKPFSEAQLLARVAAVLRRSVATSGRRPERRQPEPRQPATSPPVRRQPPLVPVRPDASVPASLPRLGGVLAQARRERGMSLHDAERSCGVRWEFLQALEREQFDYLPRAELRNSLRAYSDLLRVDLTPYMRRNTRQRRQLPASLALSAVIMMLCLLTLVLLVL
ncbi:MAG: response regulator [Oscillochloris sp.]|nr:response regulator [Oscillochloris sp.]